MLDKIDHVGIAVRHLDEAIARYTALCGCGPDHLEEVTAQKVKVAMFGVGESRVELLMATAPEAQQPTLANAIWSGKEAALKAIRRGLAEDTRLVTCLPAEQEETDGWRPLYYRWEAVERGLPALTGRWREGDGFVMTLAVARVAA